MPETKQEKDFDLFLNWIINECFPCKINRSWAEIIFIYSSDEKTALDRLFHLFEEYLEQRKAEFEDNENHQGLPTKVKADQ